MKASSSENVTWNEKPLKQLINVSLGVAAMCDK